MEYGQPSFLRQLIFVLEQKGVLRSPQIRDALNKVDREKFIPGSLKSYSYVDEALPIGEEQTISQPSTVVFMLELLHFKEGEKVLDIGAGSGWTSCLLSHLVGEKGSVHAFEINEIIGKKGQQNIKKFCKGNVLYRITDAAKYWDAYAKYDKIHVAAAFDKIPQDLLDQLNPKGGVLVAPTKDGNLWRIERVGTNKFKKQSFYGFDFVPFIES